MPDQNAQVIAALQSKGGAFKSTMIQCLAARMGREGAKVIIIDTDHDQYSCIDWAEQEDIPNVDVLSLNDESKLLTIIKNLKPKYDAIFIDTGGYDSRMASYAIQASDLILIPSGGSKSMVKGAAKTYEHARITTEQYRTPPTIRMVIWGIKSNTEVFALAKATIEKSQIPTIDCTVGHLTGFEAMSWNGGLPRGVAGMALTAFIAAIQTENLIDFYNEKYGVIDGKAA